MTWGGPSPVEADVEAVLDVLADLEPRAEAGRLLQLREEGHVGAALEVVLGDDARAANARRLRCRRVQSLPLEVSRPSR